MRAARPIRLHLAVLLLAASHLVSLPVRADEPAKGIAEGGKIRAALRKTAMDAFAR